MRKTITNIDEMIEELNKPNVTVKASILPGYTGYLKQEPRLALVLLGHMKEEGKVPQFDMKLVQLGCRPTVAYIVKRKPPQDLDSVIQQIEETSNYLYDLRKTREDLIDQLD